MINFSSKLIFMLTLMSGSFITLSSTSWMGMWMGLELNLLSFIPLMISTNNLNSTEASIKYFLIQTFASLMFLFSSIFYMINMNFMPKIILNPENLIINLSMLIKLGAAPFHFWFPNIIDKLSWMNSLILLTWQKLAPLTIISYSNINNIIFISIFLSAFVGAIGGLNQTSLQKLMSFSSINHISWLLISEFFLNSLWMFYFFIYSLLNLSIICTFYMLNLFYLNQIFMFNNKLMIKFFLFINFLSLGGLPPFLGFLPKWMIIENLISLKMYFFMLFMIMMTLITLYYYTRLTFSAFMINYPSYYWKMQYYLKNYHINLFIILLNFISIISLNLLVMMNFFIY